MKSAIVYKAELPEFDILSKHLGEMPLIEIADNEMIRYGFVANERTAELVTPLVAGQGYTFSFQIDEKQIPASTVKRELDKRCKAIEDGQGRKVFRKERSILKDDVLMEFCERALVKSTVVTAYYSADDKLLFIDGSTKNADRVIHALVLCVGSIKTETIHISDLKHGLSTRMTQWLEDEESESFGMLKPMDYCRLVRQRDESAVEKIQHTGVDLRSIDTELLAQIGEGFKVDRAGFCLESLVCFQLTEKFHFKKIDTMSYEQPEPENEEDDGYDPAFMWRHEASVRVFGMCRAVNELCSLLEYKAPEQGDSQAA